MLARSAPFNSFNLVVASSICAAWAWHAAHIPSAAFRDPYLRTLTKCNVTHHAQAAPGSVGGTYLAECNVMRNSLQADVTLKTDAPANLMLFWAKLEAKFAEVRP
mmetsp:Transcript_35277/g.60965  ORF Transcript_35277/g.60965 Transcript_35277/m.60965 type:complete len:105 (+) Transcript_35277:348-662(+)